MATKNDITNDSLITKASSEAYRNNYDLIFKKKEPVRDLFEELMEGVEEMREHRTKNTTEEQDKAVKELVELSEEMKLYD